MPRSAIMITKSLKLNLKLVYQLTQRMMICPSKCRPLNSASTGTNRCNSAIIPDQAVFAPEPPRLPTQFQSQAESALVEAVPTGVSNISRPNKPAAVDGGT